MVNQTIEYIRHINALTIERALSPVASPNEGISVSAYLNAMRRYFDFSGRSTRSQYWLFTLFLLIIGIVAIVIDGAAGLGRLSSGFGPVTALVLLIHLIPSWSLTVRRLHDIGRSGWWVLIGLIPILGVIVMLVFLCTASKPTPNRGSPTRSEPTAYAEPPIAVNTGPANLEQLERLNALRKTGAIDDEEFGRLKANLLSAGK